MVLANMVCSRLCEELWLFFFVLCAYDTSYAQKGGLRPVKNKINTSGVAWGGRERTPNII
jgi:hypothetical protein